MNDLKNIKQYKIIKRKANLYHKNELKIGDFKVTLNTNNNKISNLKFYSYSLFLLIMLFMSIQSLLIKLNNNHIPAISNFLPKTIISSKIYLKDVFLNINKQHNDDITLNKKNSSKSNYETNYLDAQSPLSGIISSGYGYRVHPIYYTLNFHPAIDIIAEEKTPIHAILDGKVKEIGSSEIFGNYIIITHKNNIESKYCHCSQINTNTKEKVNKGDIIAIIGNSGTSTGTHLHLEIKINDINIDPLFIIPKGNIKI